jgi:hypothetical protein
MRLRFGNTLISIVLIVTIALKTLTKGINGGIDAHSK